MVTESCTRRELKNTHSPTTHTPAFVLPAGCAAPRPTRPAPARCRRFCPLPKHLTCWAYRIFPQRLAGRLASRLPCPRHFAAGHRVSITHCGVAPCQAVALTGVDKSQSSLDKGICLYIWSCSFGLGKVKRSCAVRYSVMPR